MEDKYNICHNEVEAVKIKKNNIITTIVYFFPTTPEKEKKEFRRLPYALYKSTSRKWKYISANVKKRYWNV